MGKGFSLKGRTGVKECLAFQTPNPFPLVWNAGLHWSTHACPHTQKHVHLSYTLCWVCAIQAQVVVIDRIQRLKINICLLTSSSPHPLCLMQQKLGLWVPSPLSFLTFHLTTHLLSGHQVSLMLRHQSAGDVGNLSGQPYPHFSACVCQQSSMCMCWGAFY